ncbi:MAG: phage major capsid protein, partial [Mesorhizobium sp.]|nr:phage major capsid protein [Mesorhizobium sp.]
MSAHFRLRPRGLVAALNNSSPAAILNELSTAFADFRTRNDNTIRDIRASIDEINAAFAAHRIGGGAGDNPNVQRAQAALVDFMRTGRADAMAALLPQNRSMSSDSDPDGGYTVPEQIDSVIQNQLIELSPMRALASIVRTSTADYSKLINRRGATSGWVGERSDRPTTDTPMLGEIKPPMGELYAQPEITARLMDDSAFDLAAFLQENVSDEFSMQEAGAFVFGDGVEKPRGFLSLPTAPTADATRPFGTLQYKATGVAGDIF